MPGFPTHIVGTPTIRGSSTSLRIKKPLRGSGQAGATRAVEKIKIDQLLVREAGPGMVHEEKRDFSLRRPTHSQERMRLVFGYPEA